MNIVRVFELNRLLAVDGRWRGVGHRPNLPRNKLEIRGSVSRVLCAFPKKRRRSFIWDARYRTPRATYHDDDPETGPYAVSIWSCSRRGLPCHGRYRPRGALLPHHFTLTSPIKYGAGGLFSVALSLESPPPGVIRRRVSVEPGLSSPTPCRNKKQRQSPDPLTEDWHRPKEE